jgi:glycosyltransferase involved in cell wall biosynthesis
MAHSVKVAMVARTVPPVDRGGIQTHVLELCTALVDRGADVRAYLVRGDYPTDLPFEVVQVPYVPLPRLTAGQYVSFSLAAGRRLRGDEFDVVHGHSMYGWGAALAKARPLVLTCHGTQLNEFRATRETTWDPNHRTTDYISFRMERYAALRSDLVVAVSEENRQDVVDQYGVDETVMRVVPNGIRPERFSPAEPEGPVILSVGRLHQRKGLDLLIRAMPSVLQEVPKARLLIAGRGEREGELRNLAKTLDLEDKVEFLGFVPDDDLPALYRRAMVFAMPSLYEGFGIVMLEAMASSVPVVAFRTGATPEVIEDGVNGFLADAGTLADRLIKVLMDPGTARTMGRRARERVEAEYSWRRVAEKTMAVYEDAIGSPR